MTEFSLFTSTLILTYVLTYVLMNVLGLDNEIVKYFLLCLFNIVVSLEGRIRWLLSPLLDTTLSLNIYRYTGGAFLILIINIPSKFFGMILIALYISFFSFLQSELKID